MSSNNSLLCKDLEIEKIHRCCYTGGKSIYSHLNNEWICCLNNGEITILSIKNGEIIFNINSLCQCIQTLSPLNKIIKNQQEMDNIINFDLSLNDKYIVIITKYNFIKIMEINYNDNKIPINIKLINEFKTNNKYYYIKEILFNINNDLIICGTGNGKIICFDIKTGNILHKFDNDLLPINIIKINIFKHYEIIIGSNNSNINCYNLRNKNLIKLNKNKKYHKSSIIDIKFINYYLNNNQNMNNYKLMISISINDCIIFWDINNYKMISIINLKYSLTKLIYFNNYLYFGDENGKLYLFKLIIKKEKSLKISLINKEENQYQICSNSIYDILKIDNNKILIISLDCNFFVFCLENNKIKKTLIGFNDEMLDVIKYDNDSKLIIASNSFNLKIFDYKTFNFKLLIGHKDIIMSIALNNKNIIASASKDKTIRFWKENKCISIYNSLYLINCIISYNNLFICGLTNGSLKLLNLSHCLQTLICHENNKELLNIDISFNNKYIITCGQDNKLVLISINDNKLEIISSIKNKKDIINCKFSSNDKLIATSHKNGEIYLWQIFPFLSCIKILSSSLSSPILDLLFINYSTQIISTSSNGVISIWSLIDNQCIKTYKMHYDKIWKIIKLKQENKYLSIGCDSIINIWNDKTIENEKEKLKNLHKIQINKTKIDNFIKHKNYKNAIKLCLKLNQTQKLFKLLLNLKNIDLLNEIIINLNLDELSLLFTLIIDFNTRNNKYCYLCQLLLNIIYKNFEMNDLLKLDLDKNKHKNKNKNNQFIDLNISEINISNKKQKFLELNSGLTAYCYKHLNRINDLIQNLHIFDSVNI